MTIVDLEATNATAARSEARDVLRSASKLKGQLKGYAGEVAVYITTVYVDISKAPPVATATRNRSAKPTSFKLEYE